MGKIAVVGAGAWGTALAITAARAGNEVTIRAREPEVVASINEQRENSLFLPGVEIPSNIKAVADFAELDTPDFLLMVAPAQFVRLVAADLSKTLKESVPVVLCSKGIEQSSGKLISDVMAEVMPKNPLVVLSGPSFALEAARGLPTAVTIASKYQKLAQSLAEAIGQPTFRPYLSRDVVGAEIGGAVKNVFAIACGVVAGKQLGENARAALITRSLAEMVRFGESRGADPETMVGLSGLGDLILTCSSPQSRNMSLGMALGEGKDIAEIMKNRKTVAEGYYTSEILYRIATEEKIDMPVAKAVYDLLHGDKKLDDVISELLSRPISKEEMF
ncbi:NAD(P)H-dependent glycerol-3-phosphate dehydrogenase [Emcibacter nanhaiensis]|uniref:Glycerol-3-phosphate dehydrogenase [NAD(P)+] n=1 Tax=Emcibacter nanhaiensis TaxID=1505037 RepID=A0A501PMG2_9PROT|nr:NAD(P)H-dependent glycerol-3-phosphate dehydrogenase [Emcibacter nanhaiensis]TPD61465.1 NAD(P)-dependent glycerol-3-phosphate dehydrogenase [Emcibacter nanhaiensis]